MKQRLLPAAAAVSLLLLAACAARQVPPPTAAPGTPGAPSRLWRSKNAVVLIPTAETSAEELARQYLGGPREAWRIEEYNHRTSFPSGQEVVIPLLDPNPRGILADGYRTVPVLCYHRFGDDIKNKLVISAAEFERQMGYLASHGYRVVPLASLEELVYGRGGIPPKAVAVTIDDGYRSTYDIALPIIKKYNFPATLFIYTDYIGAGSGALTWELLKEMEATGLIDTQLHTKSHSDLTILMAGGADKVRSELLAPMEMVSKKLGHATPYLAYPYGKTNAEVIALVKEAGYRMALTVDKGGNAFFQNPWNLRRTMIFSGEDFDRFLRSLAVQEVVAR